MDREAWCAAIHWVVKSCTGRSNWTEINFLITRLRKWQPKPECLPAGSLQQILLGDSPWNPNNWIGWTLTERNVETEIIYLLCWIMTWTQSPCAVSHLRLSRRDTAWMLHIQLSHTAHYLLGNTCLGQTENFLGKVAERENSVKVGKSCFHIRWVTLFERHFNPGI